MSDKGKSDLVVSSSTEIATTVDSFSEGLTAYLEEHGLPCESLLVAVPERRKVFNNLPAIVVDLSAEYRSKALYISKFAAASAAGLFDAALNYLWDETVSNLRAKVARFDLDYFFDSVVTDAKRRNQLKTEDDLVKLEDWELVKGCFDTGLITNVGYKHLSYIRDMRNFASAAHPNQNELTGLQLVSWLETCIREVLSKEPSGAVITVRKLLNSLRTETLSAPDVKGIYLHGHKLPELISTDNWNMDFRFMERPNAPRVQLDLFYDYRLNVSLYPKWHAFLRDRQPKTIVFWGQDDVFFTREGGEAYLKDLPQAEMHRLDSGHFAVEDCLHYISSNIHRFYDEKVASVNAR